MLGLVLFGLENFVGPGIFWGVKFQAHVFFWVHNMKLRRTPRHVYCKYPPWATGMAIFCASDECARLLVACYG